MLACGISGCVIASRAARLPLASEKRLGLLEAVVGIVSIVSCGVLLSKLRAPIKQNSAETIRPQNSTDDPEAGTAPLSPRVIEPRNTEPQHDKPNGSADNTPLRKIIYDWTVSGGTIGLLVVNALLWCTQIKQFTVANRPHVFISSLTVDKTDLSFPDPQKLRIGYKQTVMEWPLTYEITNSGNVPAAGVSVSMKFDHTFSPFGNKWREMAPCDESDKQARESSYGIQTAFPKYPMVGNTGVTPVFQDADGKNVSPDAVKKFVLVCITYRDEVEGRIRHTRMLFKAKPEKAERIVDPHWREIPYSPIEGFILRDSEED
jgi:hypothetical protein